MAWSNWKMETFPAGTRVFAEGETGAIAYLVDGGNVEIYTGKGIDKRVIAQLGPGQMLGEIALLGQCRRTASATATEDTSLIPITREMIEKKLAEADPLLCHLLDIVVDRYRGLSGHQNDQEASESASRKEQLSRLFQEFAVGQIKLAQDLSDAIEQEAFQLVYQPIIRADDESVAGFEALIRWDRPRTGFVPPPEFIGLAEETGQIIPIGRWIVKTACQSLGQFQTLQRQIDPDAQPLFMSINMSAAQLQELGEVEEILSLIEQSGISPQQIKIEITETAIIKDPEKAIVTLRRLKDVGLRLAIDDFGTGYSSLSYLERFPLDTLKVDKSFVTTMLVSEGSQRIIRALVSLARELEMDCVAEGVEQADQLQLLREIGCDYIQGYFFSPPLASGAVEAFLRKR